MFCHRCGQAIAADYRFCPQCGSALPGESARATASRMEVHVKVLAVAYIVYNLVGLLGSVSLLLMVTTVGEFLARLIGAGPDTLGVLEGLLGSLGLLLVLESIAGLFAGFGLLQYRAWARTLTIILSLINLLHIPFGTVLGLYGLWVLISAEGERHYQQMAVAAG